MTEPKIKRSGRRFIISWANGDKTGPLDSFEDAARQVGLVKYMAFERGYADWAERFLPAKG